MTQLFKPTSEGEGCYHEDRIPLAACNDKITKPECEELAFIGCVWGQSPTEQPTQQPTEQPSEQPTQQPTQPTQQPTEQPTLARTSDTYVSWAIVVKINKRWLGSPSSRPH